MTTTKTYTFDTPSDYTYDENLIEVSGGSVKLILQDNPGQVMTETFTADTGFTYDSSKAEFTGSVLQQKYQAPDNAIAGTNFDTKDFNWGDSSLIGTLGGTASVSGNELLMPDDNDSISYTNIVFGNQGAIKLKFTPDFSNPIGQDHSGYLFGNSVGHISLQIKDTGGLIITIKNDANGNAGTFTTSPLSWVNGVQKELELNWNISGSFINVYEDGILLKEETTLSGVRSDIAANIYFGTRNGGTLGVSGSFADIIIYDTEQHTGANYTPGYTVPPISFAETYIQSPEQDFGGSLDGVLQSVSTWSVVTNGDVKFTFNTAGGVPYWYDGNSWVVSDTSYTQSNTAADMITNLPTYSFPSGVREYKYGITFPDDNLVQNNIDNLNFVYSDQIYPTSNPVIRPNNTFNSSELIQFQGMDTVTGSDLIKYIVYTNGQDRYVTGGSAANSDGTYAQSSTDTEIFSDISNVVVSRGAVYPRIFIHSEDGQTTPELNTLVISYDASPVDPDLTLCSFDMLIYDHDGPVSNETVQIRPFKGFINTSVFHPYIWQVLGTTDSTGWFSADIYVQADGSFWEMKVGPKRYKFSLPDATDADLTTLTSFEEL